MKSSRLKSTTTCRLPLAAIDQIHDGGLERAGVSAVDPSGWQQHHYFAVPLFRDFDIHGCASSPG